MPIDFNAEKAKLDAKWGNVVSEFMAPSHMLALVIHKGNMNDFRNFFSQYARSGSRFRNMRPESCEAIFGPRWMARFEPPHLKWIYRLLRAEDSRLKYTARIVADRRIALERRALCFHAVFSADTRSSFLPGMSIMPHFWWYNRAAWQAYGFAVGRKDDDAFIRRLGCIDRQRTSFSDSIAEGVERDSVAIFEMNREFENRQICDSLMRYLISRNAARCFVYLLAHHAERVFKLRSPQEWLLTVCRCAKDELAMAAVNELERQFPGIAAGTHDPWGGNPLWCTFCELGEKEKLRAELIRLGCDPDEENEFGISCRLLWENAPDKVIQ